MKQCPQCKKTYADDDIYCHEDGSTLSFNSFSTYNETPTLVLSPPRITPQPSVNQPAKWVYPLVGVLSGLIIILAFLAFLPYLTAKKEGIVETTSTKESDKNEKVTTSQSQTMPSPTIQTIIVEKEVPKIIRVPQSSPQSSVKSSTNPVVTVNTPRDGYLALKSGPCIDPCETILKIPHGTRLILGTCNDNFEVADRRRGRWCYTNYGGYAGWIFDAFVRR